MADEKPYTIDDVRREASRETEKAADVVKTIQLIVFKLGDEEYGLSIDMIKEVISTPNIARVPQTPDYVKGVANIRGNIITVLDLEQKFGLAKPEHHNIKQNFTLVLKSDEYKAGVLVRQVPGTLTVKESDIDLASGFIQYTNLDESSIIGVVKSGNRMIILIDMIRLIQIDNLQNISASIQPTKNTNNE